MVNDNLPRTIKSRRLERAVETATEMYLSQGIENVKMTDIADACGVGVATLYRYFGTKTGITIAAMTHLWYDLAKMFSGVFESEVFLSQTGHKQMVDLMKMFAVLYEAHPKFMKMLGEFDLFLIRENVPKDMLVEYDKSIINFYTIFERAYQTGLKDGTVREIPKFKLFYLSFAHALMELGKKLIQGELLPSDDFSHAKDELAMIIETASYYLRKE